MRAQVGFAVWMALVAASGCTKQTAGLSGSSGNTPASTPESTIIQQATQTPATAEATLPPEPSAPAAVTAAVPAAPAPIAPVETAAAVVHTKIGSAREIQQALKQAGFYQGSVDGKVGPKTQQAIKEFQQAHQLKADGKVGPKTWAALASYLNAPAQEAAQSAGPTSTQ